MYVGPNQLTIVYQYELLIVYLWIIFINLLFTLAFYFFQLLYLLL